MTAPNPTVTNTQDDPTQPVLIRYDYPETQEQRNLRIALGKPAPTYAFMCRRVEDEK